MLTLLALGVALAAPPPALPLTIIRLHETGVGQFVRAGRIDKGASLPLPASHLDDAIKTLSITADDGNAPPLRFPSRLAVGMARAQANLPAQAEQPLDQVTLLTALRGAAVKVRTTTDAFQGRLLDVSLEPRTVTRKNAEGVETSSTEALHVIQFLTEKGELRRVVRPELLSVAPLEASQVTRMHAALDALSSASRRMAVEIPPAPTRITASYATETPVWRVTWRLKAQTGTKGTLQGWALIHNDTDEDWNNVRVELLSGKPDSFVYPLAAPRYAERPLVTPTEELSTVPQLLGTTPDQLWGDNVHQSGAGMVGYGSGGGGRGFGSGSISSMGKGGLGDQDNAEPDDTPPATPSFTYVLATPVTLPAHHSALVPLPPVPVEAMPVTLVQPYGGPGRLAVFMRNTSAQALPEGPIALEISGRFAGEAVLPRLPAGHATRVEHGDDLDVRVTVNATTQDEKVTAVNLVREQLRVTTRATERARWTVHNASGIPRVVHVLMDSATKATGPLEVTTDNVLTRDALVLQAKSGNSTVEGRLHRTAVARINWADVSAGQLQQWLSQGAVELPAAGALKEALALAQQREKAEAAAKEAVQTVAQLEVDAERLRGHVTASKDAQMVARLLKTEDALNAARAKAKAGQADTTRLSAAVQASIRRLPRDEN